MNQPVMFGQSMEAFFVGVVMIIVMIHLCGRKFVTMPQGMVPMIMKVV